jgi:serine/threonine protein kinase
LTAPPAPLQAALHDRYRIERQLGAGGMATVYLAEDRRHGRQVALKVLRKELAAALGHDRFLREIGIVASLVHPGITSLLDSGEAAGQLYYVMPYLEEDSLRARLNREGELPVAEALRIARGVLAGLQFAHSHGIVHRDIKPENILFSGGQPQLADFGIAKAAAQSADAPRLTETGLALGTPAYMAPEQAAGDPRVDHRTDLYAVGLVCHEMLLGALPFATLTPSQQMVARLSQSIPPLHAQRPAIPPAVSELVARCLEPRPADRWQSAEELVRQIDAMAETAGPATIARAEPEPVLKRFELPEAVCYRLSRSAFDPRMPGDAIRYLDNNRTSEILVCYLARWSIDPEDGAGFLRRTPYRAVCPALFGFDSDRRYRPVLPLADHLILLGEFLAELQQSSGARHVIVVGFSTGGDVALRLAAADLQASHPLALDGCVSLGSNLGLDTCFLSHALSRIGAGRGDDLLPFLRQAAGGATTLRGWLIVNEYLVRLIHRFRDDVAVLQAFGAEVAGPFAAGPLDPFVQWYRAAAERGRRLRCVFEDDEIYRPLVRELLLRNREQGVLGPAHQEESILVEPGTGHFDLEDPELIARHLEPLVQAVRGRQPD